MQYIAKTIKEFGGLDNVNPFSKVASNRLSEAYGVEVMNSGVIRRVLGYDTIYTGSGIHSLYSDGYDLYFREGSGLYRYDAAGSVAIDSGFESNGRAVSYLLLNGITYYSDGFHNGVIQNRVSRSFGLVPPVQPVVTAISGGMQNGRYLVAVTYIRNDGQESGATAEQSTVDTTGISVALTASSDSTVDGIGVYVSSCNGEILYLYGTYPNTTNTISLLSNREVGRPLDTSLCGKMPAGEMLTFYRGRLYCVQDNIVWFSVPYRYELLGQMDTHFLPFEDEVMAFLPVDDGIWVSTAKESMFLSGTDPHSENSFTVRNKVNCGAVKYTGKVFDGYVRGGQTPLSGKVAIWTSGGQVAIGGSGGLFIDVTGSYFKPPEADYGMSFVRGETDLDQYIFGIYKAADSANPVLPSFTRIG